jgi:hypothetical protein
MKLLDGKSWLRVRRVAIFLRYSLQGSTVRLDACIQE